MSSSLFQSSTLPVLQEVVNFSQARHTVLAGNIANMDTPGYKVRDLSVEDFQDRLRKAIEQGNKPAVPDSLGQTTEDRDDLFAEISKDPKSILYHDESNVGLEFQVTEMVKNQMQHNLALTLMTTQFRQMQVAISGRV